MLVLRSATHLVVCRGYNIVVDIIIENAKAELNGYTIMNCELCDKRYLRVHISGDR